MTVGERIRAVRSACGLSQAGLADRIHVSHSYQCKIENGSSSISLEYIQAAAQALDVPPQDLLCDIFVYPDDPSTAEQIRILVEKLPPETQKLTFDILQGIISRIYPL